MTPHRTFSDMARERERVAKVQVGFNKKTPDGKRWQCCGALVLTGTDYCWPCWSDSKRKQGRKS